MSLYVINPLPAYSPDIDVEGYIQELFAVWLRHYFSGVTFSYRDPAGATAQMTWPRCDLGFEETAITAEKMERPFIHLYHPLGAQESRCCGFVGQHRMICDVVVPVSLATLAEMPGQSALHHCRSIADHLHWLFRSDERAALAAGGVIRLEPLARPSPVASPTGIYRRMFAISFQFCTHPNQV